jgi:apolipoprotein N-acyltransferase
VTAGLIPLGVWSFGKSQLAEPSPPTERLRVGWVQPNFSTLLTDKAAPTADPLDQLLSQTDSLIQSSPALALLVWPEVPFPLSWIDYADQQLKIRSAVQTWQVPLLLVSGTVDVPQQIRGEGFAYRNEAHWIAASGVLRGQYAKRQLVPFGEELPWEEEFPALREWFPHARRYLAGEEAVLFPVTSKVKVLPLICYEIASPAFHREGVQQQAQLIWNPTNDGWFPERMAQWHRALAQSRSVESGLPLLRVSNSGESVFTDAQGRVLASAAWNTRAQGVIEVALPQDVAAWPYIDQEVLWGLQAWCLLDVGLGMLLRKKREEEESEEEAREPANRP